MNHTRTSGINGNKTPFLSLEGKNSDVSHLKVFGCMAYAYVPDTERQKLDNKAMKLWFVGYFILSKCYKLLDEETSWNYVRREVVFNEQDFGHGTERVFCRSLPETLEVQPRSDDILNWEEQAKPLQMRQFERIRWPAVRYGIYDYVDAAVDSIHHHAYSTCQIVEPQTMEKALAGDCSEEWKQATDA